MGEFDSYLNELVSKNKKQFSDFEGLKWLNPYQAESFQKKRDKLLEALQESFLYKGTKPYYNRISEGCKLCGQGKWSCLFITGKCNAGCFYCPSPQLVDEPPTSQNLMFETADAYAEYINYFKFKGVSFSGGEPLLFFDRTLNYLKKVRKNCGPGIYTWMYTNGILAEEEKFRKLAAAGLNEIRFDIGATGYSLDKVRKAKGIIPNITVEIPAVPEEKERIKQLLIEMIRAGISNLNLHQLRFTKHNGKNLQKKGYTLMPAEQPIVLESELAALEIINYAHKHNLDIGINYCSFFFKYRFQKAGFRKQLANVFSPEEVITEKGFIREMNQNRIAYKTWVLGNESNTPQKQKLTLNHKSYSYSKETVFRERELNAEMQNKVDGLLKEEPKNVPQENPLFDIWQFEYIEKGLREY